MRCRVFALHVKDIIQIWLANLFHLETFKKTLILSPLFLSKESRPMQLCCKGVELISVPEKKIKNTQKAETKKVVSMVMVYMELYDYCSDYSSKYYKLHLLKEILFARNKLTT